jgi:acetylglutamate kinase
VDSGADGNLSSLIKISSDYGFVGDVKKVTPSFIDITKQQE